MAKFIISRRQLFILPTRTGWYYALVLIALFVVAVKFNNQLTFMMLFIFTSIGILTMHLTHNNVLGLDLQGNQPKPVFVGEKALFPVIVNNSSSHPRRSVWLRAGDFSQVFDLAAQSEITIFITVPAQNRGNLECPELALTSHYPFGLLFCWCKRYQLPHKGIAYPQPLNNQPLLFGASNSSKSNTSRAIMSEEIGEFNGLRPYREGDRLRDIHWGSLAKTKKLATLQHQTQRSKSLLFSWHNLPSTMHNEDRLQQLSHWVCKANQDQVHYQLELPNYTKKYNKGADHYRACMKALALWQPSAA